MPARLTVLKKRPEFLACARTRRVSRPCLTLQGRRRGDTDTAKPDMIRFGLTTTKKLGSAVVRNRIRRRLRAVARQVLPVCGEPGWDYVLIGRAAALNCPYARLVADLESALEMLQKTPQPGAAGKIRAGSGGKSRRNSERA